MAPANADARNTRTERHMASDELHHNPKRPERRQQMTNRLNDYELIVLVDAAASGTVNTRAAHHGGDAWADLDAGDKNTVREAALPYIFHGTKALADLGWERRQTINTREELEEAQLMVVLTDAGTIANLVNGRAFFFGYESSVPVATLALPVTVLWQHEAARIEEIA